MALRIALSTAILASLYFVSLTTLVSAHETHIYEINGAEYEIVIGSRNEPVIVDDKTGVDLEIVREGQHFVGAQDALQVEMTAGNISRIDNFEPVFGNEGRYRTTFFATISTTLSYRLFGTLEDTPIDLTFTCNPAGHPQTETDTERVLMSEGVVRTLKRGTFSCPRPKEQLGFPEAAPASFEVERRVFLLEENTTGGGDDSSNPMGVLALGLSAVALALALIALQRTKRRDQSGDQAE